VQAGEEWKVMSMKRAIIKGYRPGAIGKITELHALYYHRHWGFDLYFERKVAQDMAEFLGRFDSAGNGLWLAVRREGIVGSIAVDVSNLHYEGAHLRWFIVAPSHQGWGLGRALIDQAVNFCDERGVERIRLWTFSGLDAARHIYESHGFTLMREYEDRQWGSPVTGQMFERRGP